MDRREVQEVGSIRLRHGGVADRGGHGEGRESGFECESLEVLTFGLFGDRID